MDDLNLTHIKLQVKIDHDILISRRKYFMHSLMKCLIIWLLRVYTKSLTYELENKIKEPMG